MGLTIHGLTKSLNECSIMHSTTKTRPITFIGKACQGTY